MRTELLLEGAGMSQQEVLVVQASLSFEGVTTVLLEHYSDVVIWARKAVRGNPAVMAENGGRLATPETSMDFWAQGYVANEPAEEDEV